MSPFLNTFYISQPFLPGCILFLIPKEYKKDRSDVGEFAATPVKQKNDQRSQMEETREQPPKRTRRTQSNPTEEQKMWIITQSRAAGFPCREKDDGPPKVLLIEMWERGLAEKQIPSDLSYESFRHISRTYRPETIGEDKD